MLGKALLARFAGSISGSIAPLFALSMFLVLGAVGLAINSARGYGAKSQLHNAVDAAVLATARRASEQPSLDVTEVFEAFFNASKPTSNHVEIRSIAVSRQGNSVRAEVDAELPSLFMSLLGREKMEVSAYSVAEYGVGDLEVVLALDNTGSMAGTKIAALKSAARGLVDSLSNSAPSPEKLRIGLVPFAKYVNVGMGHRNASWLDVPADYTETAATCGDTYPNATFTNCRTVTGTCNDDGRHYSCSWQECDTNYGTSVHACTTRAVSHTWSGCVSSRAYPLNVQDGSYSTRIPGLMDTSCSQELTPLTTSRSAIRDAIDAMATDGKTYIPEGLMWGARLLSPSEPFTESQSSGGGGQVRRFLVLMTDGINTVSPSGPGHDGNDTALANQYTAEACSNVKGSGILIFTVAFEVTDNAIKDILRNCATNGGFFYDAVNSSQLTAAFEAIGRQMIALRLKQ